MVAFPDLLTSVRALEPWSQSLLFKTLTSSFENETESSKQKWLFPKRDISLRYKRDSLSQARTIWQFYQARKGKHEPFSLFAPISDTYVNEYVGTGDGSTTIWNLPVKNGSSIAIYVGGALQTLTTDYTISSGGGTDGEDKITFVVAPNAGEYLTADFTGTLKIRCKFAEDSMSWDTLKGKLFTAGLKLKGQLNA